MAQVRKGHKAKLHWKYGWASLPHGTQPAGAQLLAAKAITIQALTGHDAGQESTVHCGHSVSSLPHTRWPNAPQLTPSNCCRPLYVLLPVPGDCINAKEA